MLPVVVLERFIAPLLSLAEQAGWPEEQDDDQEQIDQERSEFRHKILARHITDAEKSRTEERAGYRAKPADADHDQHIDEEVEPEGRIKADDLNGKRPAEAGKAATERKGHRENSLDIEAKRLRNALVVDGGPDLCAEPGALQREEEQRCDNERYDDEKDAIVTEADAEKLDGAAQPAWQDDGLLSRAEEIGDRKSTRLNSSH